MHDYVASHPRVVHVDKRAVSPGKLLYGSVLRVLLHRGIVRIHAGDMVLENMLD